jgi:hypothetical protein
LRKERTALGESVGNWRIVGVLSAITGGTIFEASIGGDKGTETLWGLFWAVKLIFAGRLEAGWSLASAHRSPARTAADRKPLKAMPALFFGDLTARTTQPGRRSRHIRRS